MANSKRIKIGFYISTLYRGGAERVILNLADSFKKKGYDVALITDSKSHPEYAVPEGIDRYVLSESDSKINTIVIIHRLRTFCRKNKIDLLVSFLNIYHAVLGTIFSKTKCIISIRNDPAHTYNSIMLRLKNRLLLPMADGCVFQTEDGKNYFNKMIRKASAIIPNPVSDVFFESTYKNNSGVIVSFGRLTEQKNFSFLIDSFCDVLKHNNKLVLKIYGDGILKESLLNRIDSLHLNDNVFLCGQTSDVDSVMSDATAFVLPSIYEGMPNSLIEAMAVGMPCIATDCPCGGTRLLLENECGILVNVNDKIEMTKAIVKIAGDKIYRSELSERAKAKAQQFSCDNIMLQWEQYISDVIK